MINIKSKTTVKISVIKIFLIVLIPSLLLAQELKIDKIEPPNWWVGMKLNSVQLMVYGKNLQNLDATFNNDKIFITKVHSVENSSYAFIDILIHKELTPGDYKLTLTNKYGKAEILYPFLKRETSPGRYGGFSNGDAVYLIMPDRFANGDASNDFVEGYVDSMQHIPAQQRKGGDIQGVINKLDYIKELGFTTIWLTPVTENNTFRSYHGYATTDFYNVDPRLGSNKLYKELVDKAHQKGLKIILDHVANHFSDDHPWMKNLPTSDWINGKLENHLPANHNKMLYTDPYADSSRIESVYKGWFVNSMPDFNHKNSFVANYIIQNTVWWIESTGLDGVREDTYPYAEPKFMSRWADIIMNEYPTLNIVGEVWTGEPAFLAAYQGDSKLRSDLNTHLPAVTDFALRDVFVNFLQNRAGLYQIFNTLSKDFLYTNADNLVVFSDNHDVGRTMFYAGGNTAKAKLVYHMLLTLRGIPQIFYGSEIGMIENEDHGTLRKVFPGGFPGDEGNAFAEEGRTTYENDIFNYIKQLLELRKRYPAISKGKLTHFPPQEDVYVYIKSLGDEIILNVINNNNVAKQISPDDYGALLKSKHRFIDLKSGSEITGSTITIEPMTAGIYRVINN